MARGKSISKAEETVIRLGLQKGKSVAEIAEFLGRARMSVNRKVKAMKLSGEIAQTVADLGQYDDK